MSFAQNKQSKELKKTDGAKKQRLTGISKLDDANEAGGKNGYKCSLIITEGDSAKALAVSGLRYVMENLNATTRGVSAWIGLFSSLQGLFLLDNMRPLLALTHTSGMLVYGLTSFAQ